MRWTALVALPLALAGCEGAGSLGAKPQAAAPAPTAPDMAGRWQLSSPEGGLCNVTIGAGQTEGTMAPEGGCPGTFYTSRKWTFEQGALIIRDHTGKQLGQLAQVSPGRFEGQASGGMALTLAR
jgi:hypothetical protein